MQDETKPEGISVVLIGKNCAAGARQCLESLKPFVLPNLGDEIVYVDTGSTDGGKTSREFRKANAKVLERPHLSDPRMLELIRQWRPERYEASLKAKQFDGGFLRDFSAAREIANEAAQNDLIFWIDTDDVVERPDLLRALAAEFFKNPENNCLFLLYDYAFDPDGTCITNLWRERILRKSKYTWMGLCHETLVPRNLSPEMVKRCPRPDIKIRHSNQQKSVLSDVRNYVILKRAYDEAKDKGTWLDPRWDFYLGNACRGMEDYEEAVTWYSRVLRRSGSREDRFTSCCNIGTIYLIKSRPWRALDWFFQAHKIFPAEPRACYALARCWYELKRYDTSLFWTAVGKGMPKPELLTAVDPCGYDFYPDIFAAMAAKEMGNWSTARQAAHAALQVRPKFEPIQELIKLIDIEAANSAVKEHIITTLNHASSVDKAKEIVQCLKPEVRKGFRELQLETISERDPGTITWLTNKTVEAWDGTSDEDGIGGSEKMVLMLSREWAKKGRKVEVYGNPKDGNCFKVIKGVEWKPIEAFNPKQPFRTLVSWRNHANLDLPLDAEKIFQDLHDVQEASYFVKDRYSKVDGYLFKSEFHAQPLGLRMGFGDKVIITRNGVDLSHFKKPEDWSGRDLNKLIFCSSADRGLLGTLKIWGRVCKGLPKASLHIYYGFTDLYHTFAARSEYQHFGDEGCDRNMRDYEEECYALMDRLPRVIFHGRIAHEKLAQEMESAGIWLYPTKFSEISCMVAQEAQVAGCIPIVFPTGALKETVKWGRFADDAGGAITAIRDVLARGHDLDDLRIEHAHEARTLFDVAKLADEWLKLFDK